MIGKARKIAVFVALAGVCTALSACSGDSPQNSKKTANLFDPDIERMDDPVIARVGQSAIYRSDVLAAMRADGRVIAPNVLPQMDPAWAPAVQQVIDQRVLALRAVSEGLHETDEARLQMARSGENMLAMMMINAHVESRVTEDAIRQFYDAQKAELGLTETYEAKREEIRTFLTFQEVQSLLETLRKDADITRKPLDPGFQVPIVTPELSNSDPTAPKQTAPKETPNE